MAGARALSESAQAEVMPHARRSGSLPFGEGCSIARSRKSSSARAAGRFRADRRCTPAASCRAASGEIALCGENASLAYGHKRPRPPAPDEAVPKQPRIGITLAASEYVERLLPMRNATLQDHLAGCV